MTGQVYTFTEITYSLRYIHMYVYTSNKSCFYILHIKQEQVLISRVLSSPWSSISIIPIITIIITIEIRKSLLSTHFKFQFYLSPLKSKWLPNSKYLSRSLIKKQRDKTKESSNFRYPSFFVANITGLWFACTRFSWTHTHKTVANSS